MDQNQYQEQQAQAQEPTYIPESTPNIPATEPKKPLHPLSLISFILGLVGFLFNPLYLMPVASIATGIIGICLAKDSRSKTFSGIGIGLGAVSFVAQLIADILLSVISFGILSFLFLI